MAKQIKTKQGKTITLLNPHEKGKKYAEEIKNKFAITHDGEMKRDQNNNAIMLSDTQLAYRSGYLAARKDEANIYKWKQKKSK